MSKDYHNLSLENDDFILACSAEISQKINQEWQEIYQEELKNRQNMLNEQNNLPSVLEEKVVMTVTLDQDLAKIFNTSESINNALRHLLSAIPYSTTGHG